MTYIRYRDRMVERAVVQDLGDTLIACGWMAGTTVRKVVDPANRGPGFQLMTRTTNQVLPLVGKREGGTDVAQVIIVDYFPEASGFDDRVENSRKTERNTFAVDHGVPGESSDMEMGSNMQLQPYVFTMALYASSDAVASTIMGDLKDRYLGRIVRGDWIDLFDYNAVTVDANTDPAVRMDVTAFRHQQSSDQATPWDVNIWYAELHLEDYVDAAQAT